MKLESFQNGLRQAPTEKQTLGKPHAFDFSGQFRKALLGAVLAAGGLGCVPTQQSPEFEHSTDLEKAEAERTYTRILQELREREVRLNGMIESIEGPFLTDLKVAAERAEGNPELQRAIRGIIQIIETTARSPGKNRVSEAIREFKELRQFYIRGIQMGAISSPETFFQEYLTKTVPEWDYPDYEIHYTLNIMPEGLRPLAGYGIVHRNLTFERELDPNSLVERATLIHELTHAWQDIQWRQSHSPEEFRRLKENMRLLSSATDGKMATVSQETDSTAMGIEVVNLMTNGDLRKYWLGFLLEDEEKEQTTARMRFFRRLRTETDEDLCDQFDWKLRNYYDSDSLPYPLSNSKLDELEMIGHGSWGCIFFTEEEMTLEPDAFFELFRDRRRDR